MVKRKRLSRTIEKAIYEKYNHKCAICERNTAFDDGEVDHIVSLPRGGINDPSNLQWLCHRCNKLKGHTRTNEEVKTLLRKVSKPKEETKSLEKKKEEKDWSKYRIYKVN